jgi:hypothetical protein
MKKDIVEYLGIQAPTMLGEEPFNHWPVERSFGEDPEEPSFHYIFPQHGLELRCDEDDRISVIFLHSDKNNGFDESLTDLKFSLGRREVLARLGSPSKSAGKTSSPILGDAGPWDRFENSEYTVHIEYRVDVDRINRITIMRRDVVP